MRAMASTSSAFLVAPILGFQSLVVADHPRGSRTSKRQLHRSWKATATSAAPTASKKILRDIPGSYGLPLLGPISDRLNYFWFQGDTAFFDSRIHEYKSTVFRVNMPPGPPFFPDPRVIMLLDQSSFPVLFDLSKVSKRDVFTGTYKPSADFTGGYRILSYLDTEEARHAQIKAFCFDMLKSTARGWIPAMSWAVARGFDAWEKDLRETQQVALASSVETLALAFLTKALVDHDGSGLEPAAIKAWIAPQIGPVAKLGLPPPIEELTLHTFPIPFALVARFYFSIVAYFQTHGAALLELAAPHGIPRDEALHNLVFLVCFNTWGGLIRLLPSILGYVYGSGLAKELGDEATAAVRAAGGELTARALDCMPLLHSVVYETLRIQPPVPFQYGRARTDLVIESHKEAFRVKKGEMLCGFQPFATRDGVVFDRPNDFVPRRFMGDDGEKLLKYVLWSNGPETESPTVDNKQCAGKNFIVFVARLFLAEFVLRYDSFKLEGGLIKALSRRSP